MSKMLIQDDGMKRKVDLVGVIFTVFSVMLTVILIVLGMHEICLE